MKHTSVGELVAVSPNNQLWKCSCCYQTHLMIGKVSLRMTRRGGRTSDNVK